MCERFSSLLLRPERPRAVFAVAVGALLVGLETLVAYHLGAVARVDSLAIVYLPGVLLISVAWGLMASIFMALVSILVFNYFFISPRGFLTIADSEDFVTVPVFLAVAAVTSWVTARAREMTVETTQRRREADLSARLGHLLLGTDDLPAAVRDASRMLAEDLEIPGLSIELGQVSDVERTTLPLEKEGRRLGTLVLPADVPPQKLARLRNRMLSSLSALLLAARDRADMNRSLAESRDEYRRVAEEQAALRRVATLVAQGGSPTELFRAVAYEMGHLLNVDHAGITRFDLAHSTIVWVSSWSVNGPEFMVPDGQRWPRDDPSVSGTVWNTGRPARKFDYATSSGFMSEWARSRGIRSSVACPITVEGRLWGAMVAFSPEPYQPEDAEKRMVGFTELLGTAIANAQAHSQLAASRARVLAAADESRRRIERDLHDGAQQRLVSLGLELRAVEAGVPAELDGLKEELSIAVEGVSGVLQDLQEISRGLHPAILSKGGLTPALKMLARRCAVPVELNAQVDKRMSERLEVAVYYVVSEALTNIAKHARATVAQVDVRTEDGAILLSIRDDGVGGADAGQGSGLIGLMDRIDALSGTMEIVSPKGGGTTVQVRIPLREPVGPGDDEPAG